MSKPAKSDDAIIAFTVNDRDVEIRAPEDGSLLMALRHDLGLKGTRIGCGEGNCGACTVLVDGLPVQSCTTPLWAARNHRVQTIEGLADDRAARRVPPHLSFQYAARPRRFFERPIPSRAGQRSSQSPPARRAA